MAAGDSESSSLELRDSPEPQGPPSSPSIFGSFDENSGNDASHAQMQQPQTQTSVANHPLRVMIDGPMSDPFHLHNLTFIYGEPPNCSPLDHSDWRARPRPPNGAFSMQQQPQPSDFNITTNQPAFHPSTQQPTFTRDGRPIGQPLHPPIDHPPLSINELNSAAQPRRPRRTARAGTPRSGIQKALSRNRARTSARTFPLALRDPPPSPSPPSTEEAAHGLWAEHPRDFAALERLREVNTASLADAVQAALQSSTLDDAARDVVHALIARVAEAVSALRSAVASGGDAGAAAV